MKDMAAGMQMQMESGEMEQMEEDMEALRQLLENRSDRKPGWNLVCFQCPL